MKEQQYHSASLHMLYIKFSASLVKQVLDCMFNNLIQKRFLVYSRKEQYNVLKIKICEGHLILSKHWNARDSEEDALLMLSIYCKFSEI